LWAKCSVVSFRQDAAFRYANRNTP
jgi:hypothetical protein